MLLAIGSYTGKGRKAGIHTYRFNPDFSAFELAETITVTDSSFFDITRDRKLYAVNENGNDTDTVTALDLYLNESKIINTASSGGSSPCYITIAENQKHAFVANYNNGILYAVAINGDGVIADNGQILQYYGSGLDQRQEASHLHCAVLSPNQRHLLAADLGTDSIYIYSYHAHNVPAPLQQLETVKLAPGTGPRHIIFSPDGQFVYAIGEINATVNVFKWLNGQLEALQVIDMMPKDYGDIKSGAEIRLSPDGRFLYASQRGNANQIVVFGVDSNTGLLTLNNRYNTQGLSPRNFVLDLTGKYMLVAHQYSNDVKVFEIDAETGGLTYTGNQLVIDQPVYLRFI